MSHPKKRGTEPSAESFQSAGNSALLLAMASWPKEMGHVPHFWSWQAVRYLIFANNANARVIMNPVHKNWLAFATLCQGCHDICYPSPFAICISNTISICNAQPYWYPFLLSMKTLKIPICRPKIQTLDPKTLILMESKNDPRFLESGLATLLRHQSVFWIMKLHQQTMTETWTLANAI